MSHLSRAALAAALCLGAAACRDGNQTGAPWLEFAWPEADSLFQRDRQWLGADGAYSIDLGQGRVLWLFGDSWVDPEGTGRRRNATMISNTVGIQQGYDPSRASMRFYWRPGPDGSPAAFFPDSGGRRYWPGHGIRLDDRLLLFLMVVESRDSGLGFEVADWEAVLVPNPDADPAEWELEWLDTPSNQLQAIIGSGSVVRTGGFVHAFGAQEPGPRHDVYLVRWPEEEVRRGRLGGMEWWGGESAGWITTTDPLLAAQPVFSDGQTEFTVHYDSGDQQYVQVQSMGFGPAAVVRRAAPSLTGPWSGPDTLFIPAQVEFPKVMIYQGKAHPHLEGAELVVTYCTNSFEFGDQLSEGWLYYPRFVRVGGSRPP